MDDDATVRGMWVRAWAGEHGGGRSSVGWLRPLEDKGMTQAEDLGERRVARCVGGGDRGAMTRRDEEEDGEEEMMMGDDRLALELG